MKTPLHTRKLQVDAYDIGDDRVLLEGHLTDDRHVVGYHHLGQEVPPGQIHHMAIEMVVHWPSGRIEAIRAHMPKGAVPSCENITPNYDALVGLNIGRGFHKHLMERVRGPLGCSHLTTLILEMQRTMLQTGGARKHRPFLDSAKLTPEQIETFRPPNLDACHQWSEQGEYIRDIRAALRARLAAQRAER